MKPVVVPLPITSFNDIPGCLREMARRIEAGEISNAANVTVLVSGPGNLHPAIYGFGDFDPVKTVGTMHAAIHDILSCRRAGRDPLEKRT
jgi:hypothetical protein